MNIEVAMYAFLKLMSCMYFEMQSKRLFLKLCRWNSLQQLNPFMYYWIHPSGLILYAGDVSLCVLGVTGYNFQTITFLLNEMYEGG